MMVQITLEGNIGEEGPLWWRHTRHLRLPVDLNEGGGGVRLAARVRVRVRESRALLQLVEVVAQRALVRLVVPGGQELGALGLEAVVVLVLLVLIAVELGDVQRLGNRRLWLGLLLVWQLVLVWTEYGRVLGHLLSLHLVGGRDLGGQSGLGFTLRSFSLCVK